MHGKELLKYKDFVIDELSRIEQLNLSQIDDLHYNFELLYAQLIKKSTKGSLDRRIVLSEAYNGIMKILSERRKRIGKPIDTFGFSSLLIDRINRYIKSRPIKVFEVGCGTGIFIQAMIERGHDAEGIDLSENCIAIGRERLRKNNILIKREQVLHNGDFLSFKSNYEGKYDLLFSNDVLEHIHPDEGEEFLEKCCRMLKPKGVLWLITPNKLMGPGDATIFKHPIGTKSCGLHLKEYLLSELYHLLIGSGFEDISSRLYTAGRFRGNGTSIRQIYTKIKIKIEPHMFVLKPKVRKKIMSIMSWSEVVAKKKKNNIYI